MSKTIDNRIVQMQFDNQQFEKGVKTSMDTIDKLDSKLRFNNAKNGVSTLSNLSESIQGLTDRFSSFGIVGMTVVQRVTNELLNKVLPVISSINSTIDSMTTNLETLTVSFGKYEQMVVNQQTIMSSVQDKINSLTDAAYTMEDVAEIINRLRWYTDETSYNLDQMVNAVGNFTASGIDLRKSEGMILGIANACAEAGIGAAKADIAFTGFSKAIGTGYLRLDVWNNQLKTSGLTNSEKFRKALLAAAEAEGTLVRVNGKLMTQDKKEVVTIATLANTLTEYAWANKDVMARVLDSYSDTINGVYQLTSNGKIDLSVEAFEKLRTEMEKQDESLESLGLDKEYDQASKAIEALANAYTKLGLEVPRSLRSFRFAQEAVTWTQVIEATSTAVRSSWARTFELLFGNYEEAKKLWTDVSETMWGIFAGGGEDRNGIMELWHDNSYEDFAEGVKTAFEAVNNLTEAFRNFVRQMISADPDDYVETVGNFLSRLTDKINPIVDKIYDVAEGINFLSESLYLLDDANHLKKLYGNLKSMANFGLSDVEGRKFLNFDWLDEDKIDIFDSLFDRFGDLDTVIGHLTIFDNLRRTLKGLLAIWDLVNQAETGFVRALKPIGELFGKIGAYILENTGSLGDWLVSLSESAKETDFFYNVFKKVVDFITGVANPAFDFLFNIFDKVKVGLVKIKDIVADTIKGIANLLHGLSWDGSKKIEFFAKAFEALRYVIVTVSDIITQAISSIINALKEVTGTNTLEELFKTIAAGASAYTWIAWNNPLGFIENMFTHEKIGSLLGNLAKSLRGFTYMINAKAITEIGKALIVLAAALFVVSMIDPVRLDASIAGMAALFAELAVAMKMMRKSPLAKGSIIKIGLITSLAAAMLILSFALAKIASIDDESLIKALAGMAALFAELVIAVNSLKKAKSRGLIKFAAAMLILVAAVKIFGSMDDEAVSRGLLAIGALMVELLLFFSLMNTFAKSNFKIAAAGKAILKISAGMLIYAAALKLLSTIDEEKLASGMDAMAKSLFMFTAAALVLGKGHAIAGATALLIMAAAMLVLTPAIMLLGSLKLETIGKALLALAGTFLVFGIAAKLLGPMVPAMLGLAGALALIALAVAGLGAGLLLLSIGITALSTGLAASAAAIVAGLQVIFVGLTNAAAEFLVALIKGLYDIAYVLGKALLDLAILLGPDLINALLYLCDLLIWGLNMYLPSLVEGLVVLFIELLDSLAVAIFEHGDEILAVLGKIVWALVGAISMLLLDAVDALIGFIPGVSEEIKKAKETITATFMPSSASKTGTEYGENLALGISDGLYNNMDLPVEAVDQMTEKMEAKASTAKNTFQSIGENLPKATRRGVWNNAQYASTAVSDMMEKAIAAAKRTAGIQSPSKVFMEMGRYMDEGAAIGISKNAGMVEKSSASMIDSAITAFNDPLSGLADILAQDIDPNPTITPVVDLSNVTRGAATINDLMANQYGIGLSSYNNSRLLSGSMRIQNGENTVPGMIASLKEDLNVMKNEMLGMKIVMDSGALVGSISTKMDGALGVISTYKGRGNT